MTENEQIQKAKDELESIILRDGGSLKMKGVFVNADYFITKLVKDYRKDHPSKPIGAILAIAIEWAHNGFPIPNRRLS